MILVLVGIFVLAQNSFQLLADQLRQTLLRFFCVDFRFFNEFLSMIKVNFVCIRVFFTNVRMVFFRNEFLKEFLESLCQNRINYMLFIRKGDSKSYSSLLLEFQAY